MSKATAVAKIEWIDEVPSRRRDTEYSVYDPVAEKVRETGKVARIPCATEKERNRIAGRLQTRYPDLRVATRTIDKEYFVFLAQKEAE